MPTSLLRAHIAGIAGSALAPWCDLPPWSLTGDAAEIVRCLLRHLDSGFEVRGEIAIHRSATVESAAVVKPPAIVGPACFIAAGATLRGGVWLEARCVVGPGAEIKASFLFRDARLARLNFVGDSILGADVNLEAGSIVANRRNERRGAKVRALLASGLSETGVDSFGALIGDGSRIGANAAIAPGALLPPGTVVARLGLYDQDPD